MGNNQASGASKILSTQAAAVLFFGESGRLMVFVVVIVVELDG